MKQHRKVALPRWGEYNCALKYIVEQGFEARCILPPPLSRRTEDLGARNSPDLVCTPFKTTLGSMIEAYSLGASSTADIWQAQNFAERGFDGIVQVKSAG